jgi:RNA polymerase sigma factor (sigma-70 family)
MNDDPDLLRRYVDERAEDAFAEIVRRHIGLVYHAALRQTGDVSLAEEVTQVVFADLARKAGGLAERSSITGWLFTSARFAATKAKRGERRRQARDQEIFAMHEFTQGSTAAADWERLRPVIDEALHALDERDREAVLLRFFEGRPLAEVGAKLAMSEDTARVRVARALDKLQGLLARRGITSTTAALGVAMSAQAGVTAPVGLAASVTTGALIGGVGAGGVMTFMGTTKIIISAASLAAILAIGVAVYEVRQTARREALWAQEQQERENLRTKLMASDRRYELAAKRLSEAEADNARLLTAVEYALAKKFEQNSAMNGPITFEMVGARYRSALELAEKGDGAAALKDFLWCFDDGMTRVATYRVARRGALLNALAKLAEKYPEASAALKERRDRAEAMMVGSTYDLDSTADYVALNRVLQNDAYTMEQYDRLPVGDPRHDAMRSLAFDQFIAAQRYADAAGGKSYNRMNAQFIADSKAAPPASVSNPEEIQKSNREYVINTAANNIEVLAGAGDVTHARELAAKVLAYDRSEKTRALIEQRFARAGRAGLLSGP